MRANPKAIFVFTAIVFLTFSGFAGAQMKKFQRRPAVRFFGPSLETAIFESKDSATGWHTVGTGNLEQKSTGGQPRGFLHLKGYMKMILGMRTRRTQFIGKFSRPGAIAFDLKYKVQQLTNYKAYVILVNCSFINGSNWIYEVQAPGNYTWQHVSVPFNPSWSDQQAIAAGWARQTESPPISWDQTMKDLKWVGFYLHRPGAGMNSPAYTKLQS